MMSASQIKTAVPVVLGAMTLGESGKGSARVHNIETCNALLDIFQKHGHKEIDTARVYCEGTSEEYLGKCDWKERGLIMDTKLYPTPPRPDGTRLISHSPEDLRKHLLLSLKALKADKIDIWYLHAPDRSTPFEVTLKTVNELYQEGYFRRFALSNYQSWEVAQICETCKKNGWVMPRVYQGPYNAIHRSVEPELLPCLRNYDIEFYAFNPLAGGYLTKRYHRDATEAGSGGRFDPNTTTGQRYRARYWNDAYFDALDILRPIAQKHGLTEVECALRWLTHHSILKVEHGDKIICGASSISHMEQNLVDLEKGPLPDEVVKALDEAWSRVKGVAWPYYH